MRIHPLYLEDQNDIDKARILDFQQALLKHIGWRNKNFKPLRRTASNNMKKQADYWK